MNDMELFGYKIHKEGNKVSGMLGLVKNFLRHTVIISYQVSSNTHNIIIYNVKYL